MCSKEVQSIHGKPLDHWLAEISILQDVVRKKPVFWRNPSLQNVSDVAGDVGFRREDVADAEARLKRFAPFIAHAFPETASSNGLIESPLRAVPLLQTHFERALDAPFGRLLVKLDSHLPISGSIKARGGIYEVLKLAEDIAVRVGLLGYDDSYRRLFSPIFQKLFARYFVAVGSTGNLGLSIGLIGRKLGFNVTVHMSKDAMAWKKKMLRDIGATVIEHDADYSVAVAEGRAAAGDDEKWHFVDDEASRDLFLGYSVAGIRLKEQLESQGIVVDESHPLCVYLPCGVGGGPGGVSFGLKLAFGDNVHCFFGEPTQAPAMLVGLATGLHDRVSATDLGVENCTAADGLAVSRPSGLVCRVMQNLVSGIFTTTDDELYRLLAIAAKEEKLKLEPSAVMGFSGLGRVARRLPDIIKKAKTENVTHLVWATGGGMVPQSVWEKDRQKGECMCC